MAKRYVKPAINSEKVFSLTAQACDVGQESPGTCGSNIVYGGCFFPYKVQDEFCPPFPIPPVAFT